MFRPKPKVIKIDGISTPVDPDFRIMCEYSVASAKKDNKALCDISERFFFAGLPEGVTEKAAAKAMQDFYIQGLVHHAEERDDDAQNKDISSPPPPIFDFCEDEAYFYAAFLAEYKIDLEKVKMHWFNFGALFRGLSDECKLKRIIDIRATNPADLKSNVEKKRIMKLKKTFALKRTRTVRYSSVAERDKAMIELLKAQHEAAARAKDRGE